MNLLLLAADELSESGEVTVDGPRAQHLLSVLKVEPDQSVRLGVIDGPVGTGRVIERGDTTVRLACSLDEVPPLPRVDLLLALPRPKVLRRLWAQLAALGVGRIILTNAERVERNYFDTHLLEPAGYRPLLLEGLQQARDTRLPVVSVHRRFRVLVEDHLESLAGASVRLVADPSASRAVDDALGAEAGARVLLAVGPEGGWNAFELKLLESRGFSTIAMGDRPLRSDTACVALLALVHDRLRRAG